MWCLKMAFKWIPKKIEAIIDWPRPTTITKVINFLGLTDYYERFVEDFPKIATPLARLTQKISSLIGLTNVKNVSSCLQIVNFSTSANFTFRR